MALFDRLLLLATGLVAIYLLIFFFNNYKLKKERYNIYYIISFTVLLVSGLLLIWLTYDVLANPLVVIVAAVIPLFLALGLISEFAPKYEKFYLFFTILGLILISITRFYGPKLFGTITLATVHSIAALIILLTPIIVSKQGKTAKSFIYVTIGALLISVGGISLAFLKVGFPILSEELIFTILAPVLFLMSLGFAYGFIKKTPTAQKNQASIQG